MTTPLDLAERWRQEADAYERDRARVDAATLLRRVANDLDAEWHAWRSEELTLPQAALESQYTPDSLGRLVTRGTIPNAGQKHAPRIRRVDLPKKPGYNGSSEVVSSKQQIARSIVNSDGGHDD